MKVNIFTDGACRGNPGPGGWGVLLRYADQEKELYGAQQQATNNRMELMAAISGLQALKYASEVVLTTDSQYVRQGITEWIAKWQKNHWRNANNKPVKNTDLWQQLLAASKPHQIEWCWVKGHSGHPENERADRLANLAIDQLLNNEVE